MVEAREAAQCRHRGGHLPSFEGGKEPDGNPYGLRHARQGVSAVKALAAESRANGAGHGMGAAGIPKQPLGLEHVDDRGSVHASGAPQLLRAL
jgi:hypothetical protein